MPVPVAAVHKDGCAVSGQYQIRRAGQVFAVQAEAVPGSVQQGAHFRFGFGVLAAYGGHIAAALFWGVDVHEGSVCEPCPDCPCVGYL